MNFIGVSIRYSSLPLERGQDYCHRYNLLPPSEKAARNNLLKEFLKVGNQVIVNPPMHIDLGNLEVGDHTIVNFNFVALDEAFSFYWRALLYRP